MTHNIHDQQRDMRIAELKRLRQEIDAELAALQGMSETPVDATISLLLEQPQETAPVNATKQSAEMVALFTDVTAQKHTEEALRESEKKYRNLFETIEEMVTVYEVERDDSGCIVERRLCEANRAFLRNAGVASLDEIRGKTSSEVFGKDWSDSHLPVVQHAMDTGQMQVQEVYHPESGRTYISSIVPLDARTYLGTAWDITERKQAEKEHARLLTEVEYTAAELHAVLDALPFLVSVHDKDGRYLRVNPSIIQLFGFDPTTTLRQETADRLHARFPDGTSFTPANIPSNRALRGELVRDLPYIVTDAEGTDHRLLFNAIPLQKDGEVYGAVFAQIDITAHERVRSELEQRVAELDTILEAIADGVIIFDAESHILRMNAAAQQLTQFSPFDSARSGDERMNILQLERPDGTRYTLEETPARRAILYGDTINGEIILMHKHDRVTWISTTGAPIRAADGTIIGAVATMTDITALHDLLEQRKQLQAEVERQTLELALHDSESRYRQLFDTINSGVSIYDVQADGHRFIFKDRNAASTRIDGLRNEDVLGRSVDAIFPTVAATGLLETFRRVWETGIPQHHPVTHYVDDRIGMWVENRIYKLPTGEIVAVFDDVTPRKQAEEALITSREELRNMAIRLADAEEQERRRISRELHDQIGQNLSALAMTLSAVCDMLPPETPPTATKRFADAIQLIEETTGYLRDVILDLRPSMLDDYGILSALTWYGARFEERTGIVVEVSGPWGPTRLDSDTETALFRIAQEALMNVAKHAQASTIFITLDTDPIPRLTIIDDGIGFDTQHQTTQKTGWGLMIMRERALSVGGEVDIESSPQQGTRVVATIRKA